MPRNGPARPRPAPRGRDPEGPGPSVGVIAFLFPPLVPLRRQVNPDRAPGAGAELRARPHSGGL